ncbi:MAG: NAD-dependent epimerase/dehydratase family protein [Rhodothermales bacterium]|nr:NAD-dependent epimerase/dehydratase family protein [Rhodothermales bacterium]
MDLSRRQFLATTALASGAVTLGLSPSAHPLRILILGGTGFLGPHLVRFARSRGHHVTTFTRGRTQPTMFASEFDRVEKLVGDRASDLSALETGTWDAVIDNSGRNEAWTAASAALLKGRVGRYMYTSSTGVYYPYFGDDISEDTEVLTTVLEDDDGSSAYGVMKVLSERAARAEFGADRTVVVRPTYIVGPGDRSNRFEYWPVRIQRGGEVLVPGKPDDPVQYIDVRDLTEFMIRLLENEVSGTFNCVGPESRLGMHAFVHGVHAVTSAAVNWVSIPDYDFLIEHGVPYAVPWIMPTGNEIGSARINFDRALARGLTYRPLAKTVGDTLEWWYSDAVTEERRTTMVSGERSLMAREAEIIAAWRARQ